MNDDDRAFAQQIISESKIESQSIEIARLLKEKKILESKVKELVKELRRLKCLYPPS
jgi:ubiquinone biosynthesis protein UbiJ|tara:strand:- start:305 stop:475 length:171 start_codon:yes stop_codon:yes gene_type:complete